MTPFEHPDSLDGETLTLRRLVPRDRDALAMAASDPLIWAGHPAKTRHMRETFDPYFDLLLALGGTYVVRLRQTGQVVGCSAYYEPPEAPDEIGIGYTFLVRDLWGGAANAELKRLMLGVAFAQRDRVWFHIDPSNLRSRKAVAKLGARLVDTQELALGPVPTLWQRWVLDRGAYWGK